MRIDQLQLLRYGKFTDRTLAFPAAVHDFHLVVGPNEAGKSTTRSAILDLLYGIENRSAYDFVHAKADMRLGAVLQHGGERLEVVRIKARLKTLESPAGAKLPDTALASWLGGTDRGFFDQMFGLDHSRLEAGGNAILSASNDLGQILFQSAAGIAGLGPVRDQLAAEADSLWAKRRAGTRAYYQAADELAAADKELKSVLVRTSVWTAARDLVQALEDRRAALRLRHSQLEAERLRLERIRRVAPALRRWQELRAALASLAGVVLLPPEAGSLCHEAERELALAAQDAQLHRARAERAQLAWQQLPLDETVLQHEADVLAAAERRQQTRHHLRDIERAQAELHTHWARAAALAAQLGWSADSEAALRLHMPAVLARQRLDDLARQAAVIEQARHNSHAASADKAAEAEGLALQLQGLSVQAVSPALRVALAEARVLGPVTAALAREQARVAWCERALATARAGLGPWALPTAALQALALPSAAEIAARSHRRHEALASHQALDERVADAQADWRARQLEVSQYRKLHHPATLVELAAVRAGRDALWQQIRAGQLPLAEAAPAYEARLAEADQVADQRHDTAQAASELQSRLDAVERLGLRSDEQAARLQASTEQRAAEHAEWAAAMAALGLPGLPLDGAEAWRTARAEVIEAEVALVDARLSLSQLQTGAHAAAAALAEALGISADSALANEQPGALDRLMLQAADTVDAAAAAKVLGDELQRQADLAQASLRRLRDKAAADEAASHHWSATWRAALAAVALPTDSSVATAEAALALLTQIDEELARMQALRADRIEAMQRELSDFAAEVSVLVARVAPELAVHSPDEAVVALAARLARHTAARLERQRLQTEAAEALGLAGSADERMARARASLLPLLRLCGLQDPAELPDRVRRSDQLREVTQAAEAALRQIEEGGDGLPREALELEQAKHAEKAEKAEQAGTAAASIPVAVAELAQQQEGLRHQLEAVTGELITAQSALADIAGQDSAARAESRRQDALARMANAAERYIEVHTASRLLKWAIDRYRETRQGPMLQRAGEVFRGLTLGSFQRLSVDFDQEPLSLCGQRASGPPVPISGMSEGTRDQLFLALRLAALELHLDQGHALPFIADDLFINYDDARAQAGLQALAALSRKTQVIFLSHHDHLLPAAQQVFGEGLNVVRL